MLDKRMTPAEIVGQLRDGMTIGIGGWGPRRKPMALIREIMRSDLKDLTIAAYGGADVGMLCAAGKVKKLIFAFVSLDAIPLEPWFRKAREAGQIDVLELDEGMFQWGLKAAAFGLPALTKDAYAVIWTTTAWTLPANQALNLNPTLDYALVDTERGLLLNLAASKR